VFVPCRKCIDAVLGRLSFDFYFFFDFFVLRNSKCSHLAAGFQMLVCWYENQERVFLVRCKQGFNRKTHFCDCSLAEKAWVKNLMSNCGSTR
jgi:hypothetical protein